MLSLIVHKVNLNYGELKIKSKQKKKKKLCPLA